LQQELKSTATGQYSYVLFGTNFYDSSQHIDCWIVANNMATEHLPIDIILVRHGESEGIRNDLTNMQTLTRKLGATTIKKGK
jgi:hypothetical protein